jgi:hypothetical protein
LLPFLSWLYVIAAVVLLFGATLFGVLLISFMLYVSYNDIVRRFPLFKSVLQQHVQIESGSGKSPAPVPAK